MPNITYHALNRNYEGSEDFGGEVEHVEHYEILFDEPPDSEVPCYLDSRSPKIGDVHPDDPRTFVASREATSTDGVKFDLAVTYSRTKTEEGEDSPLDKPAVITARSEKRTILTVLDADGNPILNTAGDILGAHEVQHSYIVISVVKNMPVDPWPAWVLKYRDVVNLSQMQFKGLTWPKQTLKLDSVSIGDEQTENDIQFVQVTFDLSYRREGWRLILLNQGKYEVGEPKETVDAQGNTVTTTAHKEIHVGTPLKATSDPVFLDENGRAYRTDDINKTVRRKLDLDEIIKIEVKEYREVSFSVIEQLMN